MKRIFLVLLSILFIYIGNAQTAYPVPYQGGGSPNSGRNNTGGQFFDSTLVPPSYPDTITANLKRTSLYAGAIIRVGDDYYHRSADALRWILQGISSSACNGTEWLTGSATYSGTGLIYDATNSTYFIGCTRYFAAATTITISAANATYPRTDIIVADTSGNFVVLVGIPSANPIAPQVNPLSQIYVTKVEVPAGSLVPQCTTATTVYNEVSGSWSGASNVSGINFAYATNPYSGVVSTYIPSATNGQFVSYQNGSVLDITDYQYIKFYIRLNAAQAPVRPFLTMSFYNGSTQSTQTFSVFDGAYGFDASVVGSYQLIVIPINAITYTSSSFDKVYFQINFAPTSFQLDKIYLLACASVTPTTGTAWVLGGNLTNGVRPNTIGTIDKADFPIITNNTERIIVPQDGMVLSTDTTHKVVLWDSIGHNLYWTYQPTIRAISPIVITDSSNGLKYIECPTCGTGGGSGWSLTGNSGTTAGTNFVGTTDNQDLVFKRNGIFSGLINGFYENTFFGEQSGSGYGGTFSGNGNSLYGSITGYSLINGSYNSLYGGVVCPNMTTGNNNVAIGYGAGESLVTGSANTIIGELTDVATSSTDSSIAIGFKSVAASKQFAISPYINQIKATGLTTSAGRVLTDVAGNGILTLEASGGSSLFPTTGTGTATGSVLGVLAGNTLTLSGGRYSLQNGDMWLDNVGGVVTLGDFIDQHSTITLNENVGSKNIIFSAGGYQRAIIDSNGYVGIGTPNPSVALDVNGDIHAANNTEFIGAGNHILGKVPDSIYVTVSGTSGNNAVSIVAPDVYIRGRVNNILEYWAIVSQVGTGNPTVTEVKNTTGETFTWTRNAAGEYQALCSNPILTTGKTGVEISNHSDGTNANSNIWSTSYYVPNNSKVSIMTQDGLSAANIDDVLDNCLIKISIFP